MRRFLQEYQPHRGARWARGAVAMVVYSPICHRLKDDTNSNIKTTHLGIRFDSITIISFQSRIAISSCLTPSPSLLGGMNNNIVIELPTALLPPELAEALDATKGALN